MATFKVGQRVRIVMATRRADLFLNKETVITGRARHPYEKLGYRTEITDRHGEPGVYTEHLAPLTDPAADAFIERVKSWKPEPVPEKLPRNRITTG